MNDTELTRTLHEAVDSLHRVLALMDTLDTRDGHTLLSRIKDSYNGWPPSSGFDRTAPRSTDRDGEPLPGHADPTGEAGTRVDRAAQDRIGLEKDIVGVARLVRHIEDRATRYTVREANIIEQQATAAEDEGCSSCRRIPGPRTTHWWNPTVRGELCRWCDDYKRATGRLPTKDELGDHRDGKKIRRSA